MNAKLAVGGTLLAVLLVLALFPGLAAPWPRDFADNLRSIETAEGTEWRFSPEPPSAYFPLGSDNYGYDLLTKLLWGLRWTLAAVTLTAALRTLLGGFMGVVRASLRLDPSRDRGFSPLAGIPSFVMVFFLVYPVTINPPMGSFGLFLYQCAVMTAFDLGGIVASVAAKTGALYATAFVEAAVSAGADKRWVIRHHILPFLGEELLEIFAEQTVAVLKLVGRLGIFFMFIGGTTLTLDPPILTSTTGEIAGLIGLYRPRLLATRWLLAFPLASYVLVLAAFRLFASGLRERERKNRRVTG